MAASDADSLGEGFDFQLYRYDVSLPAAATSMVVFLILSVLHVWCIWRHRSFYFTAFTIGGFCTDASPLPYPNPRPSPQAQPVKTSSMLTSFSQTVVQVVGYAARIGSHHDRFSIPAFSIQAIFILVAPALYAASIYMILARLILAIDSAHLSIVPVRWMTRVFVAFDIISFTLQGGGGGIQAAGTLEMFELGEKIIIAGLFVQIVVFSFFVVTAASFHKRRLGAGPAASSVPWRRHLAVLYVVSAIILVRSIFRVVEYLQGNSGYLISHEIFLYIFDAVLMAVVMAIFLVWYVDDLAPSKGLKRGSGRELLPSSGSDVEMRPRPQLG